MKKFVKLLPYDISLTTKQAVDELAAVIGAPKGLIKPEDDMNRVALALSGLILHRRLPSHKQHEVMRAINALKNSNRPLYGFLMGEVAMVTANPRWREWSLSHEELKRIVNFHRRYGEISSALGADPGAYGIAASFWDMIRRGASRGNIVGLAGSVILTGLNQGSRNIKRSSEEELNRRQAPANPATNYQ